MSDIKRKVELLIDMQDLYTKNIGIFSVDLEFYEVLKILHNNGIIPKAIVSPFENNIGKKKLGIPEISIKQFSEQYANSVILLREYDYLRNFETLNTYGYLLNKNLFVDCEIKNTVYLFKLKFMQVAEKVLNLKNKFFSKCSGFKVYAHCFYDQYRGYQTYLKIRKKFQYPKPYIYIYDYSGIGDVYIFCLFLNTKLQETHENKVILTVIGGGSKRITDLFQLENVVALSQKESAWLTHLARLMGKKLNLYPITPFPSHLHTDIYSHYLLGKKINMAETYRIIMFNLSEAHPSYPIIEPKTFDEIIAILQTNNFETNNTIILSPYANTIMGYSLEFWSELANKLKELGFNVFTNCVGREPIIPNTSPISFPLNIAEQVIQKAGYFIGLRSGFCDVICNSEAFKCIIYPDYPIFNSNVYAFCSFSNMKVGNNIKEICWGYEDLNTLKELIIKSVTHAKIYRQTLGGY